jgi:sulfite reductase (NADPH) hemoprotein beta-component
VKRNDAGELGFAVWVGGGQGRTPMIAKKVRDFLPEADLIASMEAILRIYNQQGRRDNKFKARIKILVHEMGEEEIKSAIEREFAAIDKANMVLPRDAVERIERYFAPPAFDTRFSGAPAFERARETDKEFASFVARNVHPHKMPGYAIVTVSLKPIGGTPGDMASAQMDAVADIAEQYSFDEVRVSHEQNLVLPHVKLEDLPAVYARLHAADLATANYGLVTDIIACPGLDYCSLANARSIPIAQRLSERFADPARQSDIGDLKIKISGCINACGHHHVGHIGILGVDRKGEEFYQITLGGSGDETCSIGEIVGKGFSSEGVIDAVETIVDTYLKLRESPREDFLTAYRRVGEAPFQEALYAHAA